MGFGKTLCSSIRMPTLLLLEWAIGISSLTPQAETHIIPIAFILITTTTTTTTTDVIQSRDWLSVLLPTRTPHTYSAQEPSTIKGPTHIPYSIASSAAPFFLFFYFWQQLLSLSLSPSK
ncbi:hypothetical protein BZA05DRAFT_134931 [Tricharina praecox]|uniref:uncharacterized protein n=1 Tax=Tricharina praecox TaxID=43433 RepID=UPI0022209B54|nr:uncharacterized protein BZA05DRAFT_229416 [Tricharina praecox]XP_051336934.1 uncharacterized protein BZA05DRAFT_134931 [Tricharina praecox]KAI5841268.1 hypothetical protein BZA05DRAFT_229416 [Tricharina praecox]KAI5846728.1 hypothetical protein BZA05DRAFT_134931 [Tricharina praecox]